jgi:hypothetical protein
MTQLTLGVVVKSLFGADIARDVRDIGNGFAMMEARLILATVAQRCRLSLEPGQDIVPVQLVTVRPKNGLRTKVSARARAASTLPAS